MSNIIHTIGSGVLVVGMTIANWFGVVPSDYFVPIEKQVETKVIYEQVPILGASFQGGDVVGLFTTTLASRITNTATSMTLTSATDKDGNTLASSTYGFIIDEGTSVEEFVLADCTGTACTNMTRGVSVYTGTSTVSTLKYAHARGAEVKITDAPALIYATNILRGKQYIEQPIKYSSSVATTTIDDDNRNLVNYELLTYTAFNGAGVINSSQTQKGVVEMSTDLQNASSTATDTTGAPLAIAASSATSTYNSATAGLKVVVTQNNGKIDGNFLSGVALTGANNTWTGINTFSTSTATSTVIGSMPAYWIGKNVQVITTTGTSTFTVPSGINKIHVRLVGGGSDGDTGTCEGANQICGWDGGNAGGYSEEIVDVTGTSSIQVYVGAKEEWTTFGTNGYYLYATPNGGTGVGGDINIPGQLGGLGTGTLTSLPVVGGGGGSSMFGFGAQTKSAMSVKSAAAGVGYGAGGGGAISSQAGGQGNAGAGTQGIIIITW